MNIYKEVITARDRISPFIKITDAEYSPYLSKITRGHIYLKLENTQYSGSFKLRGGGKEPGTDYSFLGKSWRCIRIYGR